MDRKQLILSLYKKKSNLTLKDCITQKYAIVRDPSKRKLYKILLKL